MKFLILFLSLSAAYAEHCGSIDVEGVGEIHLVSSYCGKIQIHEDGKGWTAYGGYGLHFAKEFSDNFYPEMYWAVSFNL